MRLLPFGDFFAVLMIVFLLMALSSGNSPDPRQDGIQEKPVTWVIESEYQVYAGAGLDSLMTITVEGETLGNSNILAKNNASNLVAKKVQEDIKSAITKRLHNLEKDINFEWHDNSTLLLEGEHWNKDTRTFTIGISLVLDYPVNRDDSRAVRCGSFTELSNINYVFEGGQCKNVNSSKYATHIVALKSREEYSVIDGINAIGFNSDGKRKLVVDAKRFKERGASSILFGTYCRYSDAISTNENFGVFGFIPGLSEGWHNQEFWGKALKFFKVEINLGLSINLTVPRSSPDEELEQIKTYLTELTPYVNDDIQAAISKTFRQNVNYPIKITRYEGKSSSIDEYYVDMNGAEGALFFDLDACSAVLQNIQNGDMPFKYLVKDAVIKTYSFDVNSSKKEKGHGLIISKKKTQ
ncbi:hypothetical protein [Vibrio barjaei]|uniref:hypothetical protein n=1 Tax=Vibrio barjaei TaxID=1676683 RepID=UPI00228392BA|nr:hypothetical protein [Vibrio barjaei]MCY9870802.1 hypothetical protein [Vibrio barjaei]